MDSNQFEYAGIGRRLIAKAIDTCIIAVIYPLLAFIATIGFATNSLQASVNSYERFMMMIGSFILLQIIGACLYSTIMVSKSGMTVGKRILKIKVVMASGEPVPFGSALYRFLAEIISAVLLFSGYIMAFFDPEKRTLHDRIAQTRVVNHKEKKTGNQQ